LGGAAERHDMSVTAGTSGRARVLPVHITIPPTTYTFPAMSRCDAFFWSSHPTRVATVGNYYQQPRGRKTAVATRLFGRGRTFLVRMLGKTNGLACEEQEEPVRSRINVTCKHLLVQLSHLLILRRRCISCFTAWSCFFFKGATRIVHTYHTMSCQTLRLNTSPSPVVIPQPPPGLEQPCTHPPGYDSSGR